MSTTTTTTTPLPHPGLFTMGEVGTPKVLRPVILGMPDGQFRYIGEQPMFNPDGTLPEGTRRSIESKMTGHLARALGLPEDAVRVAIGRVLPEAGSLEATATMPALPIAEEAFSSVARHALEQALAESLESRSAPVNGDPRIPDRVIAERLAGIEQTQRETLAALREFTAAMNEWLKCRADERAAEAAEDTQSGEAGIKAGPDGLGVTR